MSPVTSRRNLRELERFEDLDESDRGRQIDVEDLTRLIRGSLPSDVDILKVSDPVLLFGGKSQQNWGFELTTLEGGTPYRTPLLLRCETGGGLLATDRENEFRTLRALQETSVLSPRVTGVDPGGEYLGVPALVMERMSGVCEWFAFNGERPLSLRRALGEQFVDLLVQIQSVEWSTDAWRHLPAPERAAAGVEVRRWEKELRDHQVEPLPEMEFVLRWLKVHAPLAQDAVLVHGDFKPGNCLIEHDRFSAVLDWETAHLGDPMEDLGWITNPLRASEQQIAGAWERDDIIARYEKSTGRSVDRESLRWWNIFSCWKLAVILTTGLRAMVEGRNHDFHHEPVWLYRSMFEQMEATV